MDVLEDADKSTMEILLRALFQGKRQKQNKKVIEEMETITDQYEEAVNRAMSHLPVGKP